MAGDGDVAKDVRLKFQVVQPPLDHVADADDAGKLAVAEALWLKRAPFPSPRQRSSDAISFFRIGPTGDICSTQ
jgi:hypothetical protein